MKPIALARRYAKALLDLASEEGVADKSQEALDALAQALGFKEEIGQYLLSPLLPANRRRSAAVAVARELGAPALVGKFVDLLARKGRLDLAPEIASAYRDLADRRSGRVRATVTSPQPLSAQVREALHRKLSEISGGDVVLEIEEDPEILGGIKVRMGDVVYDASVRRQLETLRERLERS